MKQVGGKAVVDYCLEVAASTDADEKRRQTALAALEGHVDRKDPEQVKKLLAIVKDDKAPDIVVDQAFRRLKEMPRALVVDDLYTMMSNSNWQRRRLAAATVLQMSTSKNIDEFMGKLGAKVDKNFHLPEGITYGAYLADLKGGNVLEALASHMRAGPSSVRLYAISYYYEAGTKNDLGAIAPFENDGQKVPACDEDSGCDWSCIVGSGDKKETKEIRTVGEFVQYCIRPKMEQTEPATKKGKDDKKK
jgi:hypothetical protein